MLSLKRKKLAIMLSVFFVVAGACLAFFVLRSGSRRFEGVIVEEREELYWHQYAKDLFFPAPSEVPYLVKRIKVRTKKGKTLDLAVCPWEEERLAVGMRIKGKFERKKEIEFGGLNFVLFWAGRNKIELRGTPDGVLREFRHLKEDGAPARVIRKYGILPHGTDKGDIENALSPGQRILIPNASINVGGTFDGRAIWCSRTS